MSEFWKRKIRTYFNRFDVDGDGKITKSDFELIADRFSDCENADPARRNELRGNFTEVWLKFMKAAGADESKPLTQDVLIESLKKQLNDTELTHDFDALIRNLFLILDTNQDGYLQLEEWTRTFENFNFKDTRFTKLSFYAIDSDYDDRISVDELVSAFFDFLYSQDPGNPSTFYWGHLDD